MNTQELEQVLTHHYAWVKSSGREGIIADLSFAILSGAILSGADLSGASLRVASLRGANLRGANLHGADLYGANLHGANLRVVDLSGASLHEANLRVVDLSGADLRGADLRGANLQGASLNGANLQGADLQCADLRGAVGIPVAVDCRDRLREVAAVATASQETHCIASWAIRLAGEPGRLLEEMHGTELAGRMLLGHEAALHFHDSNEDARAWLLSVLDS